MDSLSLNGIDHIEIYAFNAFQAAHGKRTEKSKID